MAFEPGAILGHYEIIHLVGRGGMGEVYKARDTRLGRLVAIKTITEALANRSDVQRRFEQECRVAATLDHPRICAVHDVGRQGRVLYLVMEFLEGESLARKTARGPLARADALGYAIEIADAVHYAHRCGVIHRDLKPANVFITPAGVKVLDFGLAKLRHMDTPPTPEMAEGGTAPARTIEGSVFGTAHYLPPERLEGKPADERSDVFGFGTIVYEMASGRRAFDAPTPAALIAAILTTAPPPLPPASGMADLDWIVRRSLARNPDDRWQSLADVETVLKWIARSSPASARLSEGSRWTRAPQALMACLVAVAVAAAAFLIARPRPVPGAAPVAFTVRPPSGGTFTPTESSVESAQLAISPDGRELAYVAAGANGISQIWIRAIGAVEAHPMGGTEGATYPFWSPDGRALGFFSGDELKRIERRGGPARALARAPNGRGGTWNAEGVILFAPNSNGVLRRISADGTGGADLTTLLADRAETSHRWPQFLQDGRHFVWFVRSSDPAREGVYLGSLDAPGGTMIVRSTSSAQCASGRLLYVVEGTLLAANLDVGGRRLTGEPVPVASHVGTSSNFYAAVSVSVSAAGVLAYAERAAAPEQLVWIDRQGRRLGNAATHSRYVDFRISPDSRYVAIAAVDPQTDKPDISVLDLERGAPIRLTTSAATDASPVWAPDGSRLMFRSNRENVHDLYTRPSSGAGSDSLFLRSGSAKAPTDWSRSGLVVYQSHEDQTRWDIYVAPWSHPGEARAVVHDRFNEVQGQLSPDERWLAYTSDESGLPEVYLQSLGNPALKQPVSTHGAADPTWLGAGDPRWRADGRELFYVTNDGSLMAMSLLGAGDGLKRGPVQRLFTLAHAPIAPPYTSAYDPAPDGNRFLVRIRGDDARTLPLTVLVNWANR
jgi:eukaryotic-like serine/threonine-protein kinase